MFRVVALMVIVSVLVSGCGGSPATPSPSTGPTPSPIPSPTELTPSASVAPTAETVPPTGTLQDNEYRNPSWGMTATLPPTYTYLPLEAVRDPATGLVVERTSGFIEATDSCLFYACLSPGLTQTSFTALVQVGTAIAWSPISQITLSGFPALRLDGTSTSGTSQQLITYLAVPGSGQVLALVYSKANLLDPYLASVKISTPTATPIAS